jgi:hypothetical protein
MAVSRTPTSFAAAIRHISAGVVVAPSTVAIMSQRPTEPPPEERETLPECPRSRRPSQSWLGDENPPSDTGPALLLIAFAVLFLLVGMAPPW